MSVFSVELQGFDEVKRLFSDIDKELSASQTRSIIDEIGKVVVNQARHEIPWNGQIGEFFKRDLGVSRDRGSKYAEYVLIGPRFKSYNIHGTDQKVAVIAQHMTQGFSQTDRETKSTGQRGRVKDQTINPVLDAYEKTKGEHDHAIQTGVDKQIKKLKAKYPYLINYV